MSGGLVPLTRTTAVPGGVCITAGHPSQETANGHVRRTTLHRSALTVWQL